MTQSEQVDGGGSERGKPDRIKPNQAKPYSKHHYLPLCAILCVLYYVMAVTQRQQVALCLGNTMFSYVAADMICPALRVGKTDPHRRCSRQVLGAAALRREHHGPAAAIQARRQRGLESAAAYSAQGSRHGGTYPSRGLTTLVHFPVFELCTFFRDAMGGFSDRKALVELIISGRV